VETNSSNIRIYPTEIHLLPDGTTLTVLIQMLNTDVRLVGFHPPKEDELDQGSAMSDLLQLGKNMVGTKFITRVKSLNPFFWPAN